MQIIPVKIHKEVQIEQFKQLAHCVYKYHVTVFCMKPGECIMGQRPFTYWVFPVRFNYATYKEPVVTTLFSIESFFSLN